MQVYSETVVFLCKKRHDNHQKRSKENGHKRHAKKKHGERLGIASLKTLQECIFNETRSLSGA
jgi:hypothetical protein